ncbi:MAG: kynureninase [Cyclobacteriaceae bacterium]
MENEYQQYAKEQDLCDPLKDYRNRFYIPQVNGKDVIYFCGNSLGLQPKSAREEIDKVFSNWQNMAVDGHFYGNDPWSDYHKKFREPLSKIVGAKPAEIAVMNNLTVNLHLGLVSFYRPDAKKYKIIMEAHAFPSDQYAVETQIRHHGFEPEEAIIELEPEEGEELLETDRIIKVIEEHSEDAAIILLGGLQYYTGQLFEMGKICKAARKHGVRIGLDLAHAVGNVPLNLSEWGPDFAVWCSYKYLNSGPGAVSGMFINEKHHHPEVPRFAGWYGHKEEERFLMEKGFKPIASADGWRLSNSAILNMATHYASVKMFEEVGMKALREKSLLLTGFLEKLIGTFDFINVITPQDPEQRGCQLSLYFERNGREIFEYIQKKGVIADWREPNVIRIAPVPLYNSFLDVYSFYEIIKSYNA